LLDGVNLTPRLVAPVSLVEGTDGSVESGQIEHGHWPGGGVGWAVVKVHEYGLIAVPATF
jgi:hypothetical protein